MVEPHLFCGPEFTLEVPSELPLPVEPNILLQLQSELYNLLTPLVRHKLHATWGTGTGSCDGTVPPPPCELCFVEVVESSPVSDPGARENEKDNVSNEKNEATVKLILRIKDSRAASELFVIGLRNPFITLPHGIRLHNRCGGSAVGTAKARATPVEILRKKELLRSRMNFDEDLWELLQGSLTSEWLLALEETYKQHKQQQSSNHEAVTSLRESQRHERRVESLLHYCEQNVLYIGVMDEEGKATPFLLAIGAFYKLGLTRHDALVHFARHHRRTIRALALFIARYTTAPEELEPFFTPSLTDEVVVACAEDQQVTCSMRQLAEDLLLHDEVCEAWPPTLHPFWIEHTVRPMMLRVEADRKRREELFQERESGVATEKEQGNRTGSGSSAPGGSGRGVGVFGFCNIMELHAYVREKQRVLVPQRVLSMLSKPRGGDSGDRDYADDGDDDDDDFLIKVRVEGDGDAEQNALHHQNKRGIDTKQPKQGQQQLSVRQGDSRKRRRQGTTTARSLAVTGAYRTILTLLGRTEPFDPHCSDLALDNIFDFLIKDIALNRGAAYLLCPVHRFLFMADASALEELRKERQRRYAQLSRTEKPRIEPCCHCNEPPYKERVCPVTGVYHNHDKQKIVGGSVVNSNIVNSSELMKAIELSRVRWAPSRTKLVRVDVTSLNLFQSFVRQSGWAVQRCGILYGKYDSAESTIEVHAVYEPEQEGGLQKFICLRDSRVGTVDRLAERLGLRRVGMVCTHQARDPDKMVLSGYELLLCAREQSRFGDECVLLTMSPSITTGRIECQAWQASPQAVHFYRLGTLTEKLDADPRNSTVVTGTADGFCGDEIPSHFVYSSISLEVAQEQTDDKGRPQVITKAPSKEIDTRWFTSYVAVDPFDSHVVKNLFVRISRPGMDPPTITNLRNYLKDPKRADVPILQKLADFHVLIFLAFDVFSGVNEVLTIIDAIKENSLAPLAEPHVKTLQLLIES